MSSGGIPEAKILETIVPYRKQYVNVTKNEIVGSLPIIRSMLTLSLSPRGLTAEKLCMAASIASFITSGEIKVKFRSPTPATMMAENRAVCTPSLNVDLRVTPS